MKPGHSRGPASADRWCRRLAAVVIAGAAFVAGCAPPPPAMPAAPLYPEFLFPGVPEDLAGTDAALRHEYAWRYLQGGDLRQAERGFADTLRRAPGFYPAEAGLGYVELAQREYGGAVNRFDRALDFAADYLPALVGRGEALLGWNRPADALESFEAALRVDAGLVEIARRVEVLRLRGTQERIAQARQASETGRFAEARQEYRRALEISPDSGFLHQELAGVERRLGDADAALAHARRALELDPADGSSLVLIGEIQEERGELEAALESYERAFARDGGAGLAARIDRLRERIELARLPAPYREIPGREELTRGELAALIGVRLRPLLEQAGARAVVLLTDTRDHWAGQWIGAVARAGIMDVFPNHTFQPDAPVRRGDLAQAISRLLTLLGSRNPGLAGRWQGGRPQVADVPPGHLQYPAVALAVSAGVLPLLADGRFQLAQPVTGSEALAAIERVDTLSRP